MSRQFHRRVFGGLALAGAASMAARAIGSAIPHADRRKPMSRVAILNARDDYGSGLEDTVADGLRLFKLNVRGKSVVLKPNLVEDLPGAPVNTHPALIGAAAGAFLKLGAGRVLVAEGPGHQRDTYLVRVATGLETELRQRHLDFVDLNRDSVMEVRLKSSYTGLRSLWLPRTVAAADFVVSMPKIKTHHWAGVTLSLKNMFGIVPGSVYGWPKNVLHWQGIDRSILDINATVPIHFVIADGIVAMEGNGPLHGPSRPLARIVMSDDAVAADFTCARLMGFNPYRITHLSRAAAFLGNGESKRITQLAEEMPRTVRPFSVLPAFSHLISQGA